MNKIIWGISALFHDAGVSVVANNNLVFGAHSERYSGKKHDKHLNKHIIQEARKFGHPDHVVWFENPWKKRLRQFLSTEILHTKTWATHPKKYLKQYDIDCPITYRDHHYSHA